MSKSNKILKYLNESSSLDSYNKYLYSLLTKEEQEQYPIINDGRTEGPIKFRKSGKILYYDNTEGKYYDKQKDLFLDDSEAALLAEAKNGYKEFFMNKLAEYGVKSPAQLTPELKTKFFNEIELKYNDEKYRG